jgi:hypothetical protein
MIILFSRVSSYGVIKPQTPTGSRIVITLFPAIDAGIVSPYVLGASSLNHSKKLAAYVTSPVASANGFPFSHVISRAKSSLFSTIKSYHFRRSFDRSRPVFLRKDGNAAAAASMAVWVSAASNSGTVPMTLPEDGSGDGSK